MSRHGTYKRLQDDCCLEGDGAFSFQLSNDLSAVASLTLFLGKATVQLAFFTVAKIMEEKSDFEDSEPPKMEELEGEGHNSLDQQESKISEAFDDKDASEHELEDTGPLDGQPEQLTLQNSEILEEKSDRGTPKSENVLEDKSDEENPKIQDVLEEMSDRGSQKGLEVLEDTLGECLFSESGESLQSSFTETPLVEDTQLDNKISINLPQAVLLSDEGEDVFLTTVVFLRAGDIEEKIELELPERTTVKTAKDLLSERMGTLPDNIKLFTNDQKLNPNDYLPINDTIIVESGMDETTDEGDSDAPIIEAASTIAPKSKIIKVKFEQPDGTMRLMEVDVVSKTYPKQSCGGYRNVITGTTYHNVWCQTDPRRPGRHVNPGEPPIVSCTRETQTLLPLIDKSENTMKDECVQMTSTGVYIPNVTDKIVTPQPYKSYDETNKTMTPYEALVIVQRAWRRYVNFKKVRERYTEMAVEQRANKEFKGTSLQEFQKHQVELLTKDSFPIGRADFYDLYSSLNEWKEAQLQKLKETKVGFAYKAALSEVLKQETKGLLAIEAQRTKARTENLQRQDAMFLEGTSTSRVREYPNGRVTVIDDLNIQKAREFKEIFASYKRTDVSKTERIEILTAIKSYLSEFEAIDMTWDAIELLDREVDFILMGIDDAKMAILRKRFESLFMSLARNPEFNPQAKYYKSSVAKKKKYAVYRCEGCRKVMQPSHLFMHLRLNKFKLCASCSYMHTTATATTNLAPYKRLLESLREAEQRRCCR
ncbi:Hypothetical protein motif and ubiquitin domain containing [Nesidiocoris tenuis]|uniref:IQ motif and ubiquitin-like domain-containing protein n=2 Tax=Nesidiocoris tenuis TaxID=355587 RepID=A0ABN7B460_9HEMI|nr:Hypothetical protein motif and ubiquitin domain containing [Nesidiocoris tenuis]